MDYDDAPLWVPPREFESAEGMYVHRVAAAYAEPALTAKQLSELSPVPCRFSYTAVKTAAQLPSSGRDSPPLPAALAAAERLGGPAAANEDCFLMYNCRGIIYLHRNHKEQPATLTYGGHSPHVPTAHGFNLITRANKFLKVAIAFSNGEIAIHEHHSKTTTWINRGGVYTKAGATALVWLPGAEHLLLVGYEDGSIFLLDDQRDTNVEVAAPAKAQPQELTVTVNKDTAANPLCKIHQKGQWLVTALVFSPDCDHVAVTYKSGVISVFRIRINDEGAPEIKLRFSAKSYFGGLLCAAWSADGRYILTGGEDDLVTVWSVDEQCVVTRGEGHCSFVNDVAFDPFASDESSYRFGSVGQDTRLLLWDFSHSTLSLPRASISMSRNSPARQSKGKKKHKGKKKPAVDTAEVQILPAPGRQEVPVLKPIVSVQLYNEPITGLLFLETMLFTINQCGAIKVWKRPEKSHATCV